MKELEQARKKNQGESKDKKHSPFRKGKIDRVNRPVFKGTALGKKKKKCRWNL